MSDFFERLHDVLFQMGGLVTEDGFLLRNKVMELAHKLDGQLIRTLVQDEVMKERFFKEVDGVLVFDKVEFGWVVNNREFLPDSFTRFGNRIGLLDGSNRRIADTPDVALVWPYKDCVLQGGMTRQEASRSEVFWNELLAPDQVDRLLSPKAIRSAIRYTTGGEEAPRFDLEENLVIRGNNLFALASLLPRYRSRIDLIYIDPPFNPPTATNTFVYNNRFSRSTWLTFMSNRLKMAQQLLTEDGVLVVAIDNHEEVYLGVLLDELFPGPKYEVQKVTVVHNPRGIQGTNFSYTHEYAYFVLPRGTRVIGERERDEIDWSPLRNWGGGSLRGDGANTFYPVRVKDGQVIGFGGVMPEGEHPFGKNELRDDEIWVYPIDSNGVERKWRYSLEGVQAMPHELRAVQNKHGEWDIDLGKKTEAFKTVWVHPKYDSNVHGTQLVKRLVPGCEFDFPKSLYNVKDCVLAVTGSKKNAIVLDFFAGSGTTAHAVLDLNRDDGGQRKFILVEQMDYIETVTLPRIRKVLEEIGNGGFTYVELAKLNERYVERVQGAESEEELASIWEDMRAGAFLSYRVDPESITPGGGDFGELDFETKKRILVATLDKNMLYVNADEIHDSDIGIGDVAIRLTEAYYEVVPE